MIPEKLQFWLQERLLLKAQKKKKKNAGFFAVLH